MEEGTCNNEVLKNTQGKTLFQAENESADSALFTTSGRKNKKCMHKEINGRLNVAYTCYHLLQRLFPSSPPPKQQNN